MPRIRFRELTAIKVNAVFGAGIAGKSYVVTRERRLNCYYENREDGDKAKIVLYGTPGMKYFTVVGPGSPAIRGMLGSTGFLAVVVAGYFYQVNTVGNTVLTLPMNASNSTIGPVSLAQNPTTLIVVDGAAGYLFSPNGGTLKSITVANYSNSGGFPVGAKTITNCSGFFVCEIPGTQEFAVSNLNDGTTWGALAFASANQYADILLAVDSLIGNLVLFSSTHMEFWQNVGGVPQPFAPILAATTEWGLAAIFSRAHVDSSICFLGQSPQGGVSVCQASGYEVKPISTPDLDYIFSTFSFVNDATGLAYRVDKHPMYQISFPTAGRSFLYDCSTGIWSETQSGLTSAYSQRHIGNLSTLFNGKQLISDYSNGNLYTADPGTFTDNGQIIKREIITKHQLESFNVFSIDELYVDMETGVGTLSGQGMNPQISLSVSKDNGRTWLDPPLSSAIGPIGQFQNRVIWRRLGSSRQFTFKLNMTDPVKFVLTSEADSRRQRTQ